MARDLRSTGKVLAIQYTDELRNLLAAELAHRNSGDGPCWHRSELARDVLLRGLRELAKRREPKEA
jgi:hypothetical protein